MINFLAGAWGISLILWPPWIYAWPYIEGQRTVPDNSCYIQFIETNHYITFGTAIAAFYVPVTVMCILYWRIWRETKKRQKDLAHLQGGNNETTSRRSNSGYVCIKCKIYKCCRSFQRLLFGLKFTLYVHCFVILLQLFLCKKKKKTV